VSNFDLFLELLSKVFLSRI
jgi:hypothetical protein